MKCGRLCNAKLLFGCFNTIFFICGVLKVVTGFLLLCDSRRILLSKLLIAPDTSLPQPPFYYVGLGLLVAGLAVCTTTALGCWITYMPGYLILTMYFLLVLSLLMCECASGVLATLWPRCAGLQNARGGAPGALQAHYGVSGYEHFTAAVDLLQTQFECCGMTDARNYDMSVWQIRKLGPRGLAVPLSCCVQDIDTISYLSPQPLNATRCQEVKPNGQFRYVQGCLSFLEEWYYQQYIIFMLALFVMAILKSGLLLSTVFSCIWVKKQRRNMAAFPMKSMENKTSENIYHIKMLPVHDEPITAKYVQPNNFYSPRVRNPRIFHNKPNEVI